MKVPEKIKDFCVKHPQLDHERIDWDSYVRIGAKMEFILVCSHGITQTPNNLMVGGITRKFGCGECHKERIETFCLEHPQIYDERIDWELYNGYRGQNAVHFDPWT